MYLSPSCTLIGYQARLHEHHETYSLHRYDNTMKHIHYSDCTNADLTKLVKVR